MLLQYPSLSLLLESFKELETALGRRAKAKRCTVVGRGLVGSSLEAVGFGGCQLSTSWLPSPSGQVVHVTVKSSTGPAPRSSDGHVQPGFEHPNMSGISIFLSSRSRFTLARYPVDRFLIPKPQNAPQLLPMSISPTDSLIDYVIELLVTLEDSMCSHGYELRAL